jgi:hypothetical protein
VFGPGTSEHKSGPCKRTGCVRFPLRGGGRESNPPASSQRHTGFEVRGRSCCLVLSGGTSCCPVQVYGPLHAVWCRRVTSGDVLDVCNVFAIRANKVRRPLSTSPSDAFRQLVPGPPRPRCPRRWQWIHSHPPQCRSAATATSVSSAEIRGCSVVSYDSVGTRRRATSVTPAISSFAATSNGVDVPRARAAA